MVDSILPLEQELRRFRVGLGDPPATLTGGASSREALVRRFFSALAAADTADLRAMALSRAEFAYLVYPSSPYTRPPYRQSPELVWLQLQSSGASGLGRLLDRARRYRYVNHRCNATPAREEQNRLWRQCQAKVVRAPGDTATVRMFGVIVEREGRFKFANFETDF